MTKAICWLALLLAPAVAAAQTIEFDSVLKPSRRVTTIESFATRIAGRDTTEQRTKTEHPRANAPGVLKSAGVEAMSTAMTASTQVFKLELGEGRFVIPFFFYLGAAGSAFNAKAARSALASVLNPLGGNFNLKSTGTRTIWRPAEKTAFRVNYNLGIKQLSPGDTTGKGIPLVIGTAEGGFRFETKAVLNGESPGIAYLQLLGGAVQGTDLPNLKKLLGADLKRRFATLAVDGGIDIKDILLAKVSLYQVLNGTKSAEIKRPVFKFGFDYTPKK